MKKLRVRELTYTIRGEIRLTGVWVIDEIVTIDGHWITWENRFSSVSNAVEYMQKHERA